MVNKQLFRQYDRFNEGNFYKYLKQIHYKFPRCYLFLDKAPQHYKSQKIGDYFEKYKDVLISMYENKEIEERLRSYSSKRRGNAKNSFKA